MDEKKKEQKSAVDEFLKKKKAAPFPMGGPVKGSTASKATSNQKRSTRATNRGR